MSVAVAARIARRELRGGLAGFRIFLLCLALGVAAIAAVGSVRHAIQEGLRDQGAVLLGGDAAMQFTYRFASDEERAWMDARAEAVSEIVDFRSMAVVDRPQGAERGLTQVKAVDGPYPLKGAVELDPPMALERALAGADGLPGAAMQPVLIDRLGMKIGDRFRLGTQDFVLTAALSHEPDGAGAGFALGPRTLVRTADLARSGLIAPGTLFETEYRLACRPAPILRRCRPRPRHGSATAACAGATAATAPPAWPNSSTGWARFSCWSGSRGWWWAGSACRRRCAPISTPRPPPSPH
jgi:putative ABC transport system permease protein